MSDIELPLQDSVQLTVEQALQQAIAHHQASQLQDAERLYRCILQAHPNHADANHNLAVLAVQVNQAPASLPHFKAALEANPKQGQYWLSYVDALIQTGEIDTAKRVLEQGRQLGLQGESVEALVERLTEKASLNQSAVEQHGSLKVVPDPAQALPKSIKKNKQQKLKRPNKVGVKTALHHKHEPSQQETNALLALYADGNYIEALTLAEIMTVNFPQYGFGWKALGALLSLMGRATDGQFAMQKAAELLPNDAELHCNLGAALRELGQLNDAVASCRRALEIKPDFVEVYCNLGNALRDLGQFIDAVASYRRALEIKSDYTEAHSSLGNALIDLGQLNDAVASYLRALEIKPDYAEAHYNLGKALRGLGQLNDAVASYRKALEIKPDYTKAHNNLGNALRALGQFNDAVASYRRALEIKPDYVDAYSNLSVVLGSLGQFDDALISSRNALQIKPTYLVAQSNLLFTLNYHPDKSADEIYTFYEEYEQKIAAPQRVHWQIHANSRNIQRRLKVGYVSPDFKQHSVSTFLEAVLRNHDKNVVEIYAYAELNKEDEVTARHKSYVNHWVATKGMSDEVLAKQIRKDEIDILIDLAGHTKDNRLGVFALKPAPVSISWLGFGYTTGLKAIDYYLGDKIQLPVGCESLFSETPWRLEGPSWVYQAKQSMGAVSSLPALENGYITLGTLTRSVRINHRTIRVWSEILKCLPNSKLHINSQDFRHPSMQDMMSQKFAEYGIEADRLFIGYTTPPWDLLRSIDIGLDCFPHNSGTTLYESLYMGVPYVTLAGRPSVGRIGSSALVSIGHPEWIADNETAYIDKAVALASDLTSLSQVRSTLREEIQNSELMDELSFVHKLEQAYREMWQKWCEG